MATTHTFAIGGIGCENCPGEVKAALVGLTWIDNILVDGTTSKVTIETKASLSNEEIVACLTVALKNKGFTYLSEDKIAAAMKSAARWALIKGMLGFISGIILLILSLVSLPLSPIVMHLIMGIGLIFAIYLSYPSLRNAVSELFKGKISVDLLLSISTVAAIVVSIASIWVPSLMVMLDAALLILGFRYFGKFIEMKSKQKLNSGLCFVDTAKQPVTVITSADKQKINIEDLQEGDVIRIKAGQKIPVDGICLNDETKKVAIASNKPDEINTVKTGAELKKGVQTIKDAKYAKHVTLLVTKVSEAAINDVEINKEQVTRISPRQNNNIIINESSSLRLPNELRVGDIIQVQAGQIIPVDGVYRSEATRTVYTTTYNGSFDPWPIEPGHVLLAGMQVPKDANEPLILLVTEKQAHSNLARLDQAIAAASQNKKPIEELSDKILRYFVPVLLIIAVMTAVISWCFFSPTVAIQALILILVSACPCVFPFIRSMATKIAITKALGQDIRVNIKAVEALPRVKHLLCDLNGTLTAAKKEVKGFANLTVDTEDSTLFDILYALEEKSNHLTAKAIKNYLAGKITEQRPRGISVEEERCGVKAIIGQDTYILGNADMMPKCINVDNVVNPGGGKETLYLAKNDELIAVMSLEDRWRDDALAFVKKMQDDGVIVHLVSGSNKKTVEAYAKEADIQYIVYGCSAEDKKDYTLKIKKQEEQGDGGLVAMLGDGGNDALAFAASDVGIGIYFRGNPATLEQADVTVGSLSHLLVAMNIAKQTMSNIKQNLLLALGLNGVVITTTIILLLAFGFAYPVVGAAFMFIESGIILYAISRLKNTKLPEMAPANQNSPDDDEAARHSAKVLEQPKHQKAPILTFKRQWPTSSDKVALSDVNGQTFQPLPPAAAYAAYIPDYFQPSQKF